MLRILYIVILLSGLGLCKLYIDKNKHEFWDIQPVSRKSYFEFIFKNPNDSLIINPNDWKSERESESKNDINIDDIDGTLTHNIDDVGGIDKINCFLKKHYSNYDYYSTEDYKKFFIACLFFNDRKNATKKIVGTIMSNPITLYINSKIVEGFYVDLLCVHKKYRGKNLAPKLIKSVLREWQKRNYNINIFKIDNKPLPFDYIAEYYYYYYDLSNYQDQEKTKIYDSKIKKMDKELCDSAYNFFYEYVQKYKMYHLMTYDDFSNTFIGKNKLTFLSFTKNNKIIGFYSFVETKRDNEKYIELTYFIGEDITAIYHFINIFKKDYKYLIFQDTGNNWKLINILKDIEKGHPTYYHLYNYKSTIQKKDIFLNL